MSTLTPREHEALVFIRAHLEANGFSPSLKEIAVGLGLPGTSKPRAQRIVDSLVGAGVLKRCAHRPRGLELVQTEDYHVPGCVCGECAKRAYLARLKLVQALEVLPPVALAGKFVGLRPLGHLARLSWRKFDDASYRKALRRRAEPLQAAHHQNAVGAIR